MLKVFVVAVVNTVILWELSTLGVMKMKMRVSISDQFVVGSLSDT